MTKNEFMEYVEYLGKTFNFTPPEDKEILATWYKPFQNTHKIIAKKMADLYFYDEKKNFNFARLLEYKSVAMKGNTYQEKKENCIICDGIGLVQFEVNEIGRQGSYLLCRRCTCTVGESLSKSIRQITPADLKNVYKDVDHVYKEKVAFEERVPC